jgi:hypothetical protein
LGQANASAETHRRLEPHRYRLALVVGFQVTKATALLDDAAGGTPQRFVFAPGHDPAVPDLAQTPLWPGPLGFVDPPDFTLGRDIDVNPSIVTEVRQRHLEVQRGEADVADLDAHRDLCRLKTAALLGILDGRFEVSTEDWALAQMVEAMSRNCRGWVAAEAARQATRAEEAGHRRAARREEVVARSAEERALASAAGSVARRVAKAGGALSRTDLNRAIAGKHKQLVSVDDVIAHAISEGWIVTLEDGYGPGESRPK